MSNPWLKRNPFLSLWLSGANKVMGSARGQINAALKREASKAGAPMTEAATRQVTGFWTPHPTSRQLPYASAAYRADCGPRPQLGLQQHVRRIDAARHRRLFTTPRRRGQTRAPSGSQLCNAVVLPVQSGDDRKQRPFVEQYVDDDLGAAGHRRADQRVEEPDRHVDAAAGYSVVLHSGRSQPFQSPLGRVAGQQAVHRYGGVVVHPLHAFVAQVAACSAMKRPAGVVRSSGRMSASWRVPMPGAESPPSATPCSTAAALCSRPWSSNTSRRACGLSTRKNGAPAWSDVLTIQWPGGAGRATTARGRSRLAGPPAPRSGRCRRRGAGQAACSPNARQVPLCQPPCRRPAPPRASPDLQSAS